MCVSKVYETFGGISTLNPFAGIVGLRGLGTRSEGAQPASQGPLRPSDDIARRSREGDYFPHSVDT